MRFLRQPSFLSIGRREFTARDAATHFQQVSLAYGIIYVTIMIRVEEYLDEEGESPFRHWFLGLDAKTAAKVTVRLERMATGNFADYKGVGGGVLESRIHFGPGYRIYFGKDGEDIVILLAGGSKRRQGNDIKFAISLWNDFRMRKKEARK